MERNERIRKVIREIAQRRNNVTLSDIEWVMDKLAETYDVRCRAARHGLLYGISDKRFMVNCHNPGNRQVKTYSVDEFISVMIDLGLYEEEE